MVSCASFPGLARKRIVCHGCYRQRYELCVIYCNAVDIYVKSLSHGMKSRRATLVSNEN
jgi:hypothetical protein